MLTGGSMVSYHILNVFHRFNASTDATNALSTSPTPLRHPLRIPADTNLVEPGMFWLFWYVLVPWVECSTMFHWLATWTWRTMVKTITRLRHLRKKVNRPCFSSKMHASAFVFQPHIAWESAWQAWQATYATPRRFFPAIVSAKVVLQSWANLDWCRTAQAAALWAHCVLPTAQLQERRFEQCWQQMA